jgi:hypothetical protein
MKNYFHFPARCSHQLRRRLALPQLDAAADVVALLGLNAYCQAVRPWPGDDRHDRPGLWGLYIANFTYLVGMAAAAVMLVIPVYIYRNMHLHDLVIFGELLAVAAIIMCLLFVTVDLGRPDRFMHMLLQRFNFPMSMLTWDVIALNGYLLLNLHICGYLIYCAYQRKRRPRRSISVRVRRDRLGDQHPHGDGVSLRRAGRAAVLELRDHRAALPGQSPSRRGRR